MQWNPGPLADFDAQEWARLAARDPALFEIKRREKLQRFVQDSGKRRASLERLQREIDAMRRNAGNAQDSLLHLSRMMVNHLGFLKEQLEALDLAIDPPAVAHEGAEQARSGVERRRAPRL